MVTLLISRLNMVPSVWKTLTGALLPSLPLLQAFTGLDVAMQRAILSLTDANLTSDGKATSLPPLEQLRASLRLMFLKESHSRAKGFADVIWLLTQQDNSEGMAVQYSYESHSNPSDIFILSPIVAAQFTTTCTEHPSMSEENVMKLWDILTSDTVEKSLRNSAAEQLGIILQGK